jgi:hypothetical protein
LRNEPAIAAIRGLSRAVSAVDPKHWRLSYASARNPSQLQASPAPFSLLHELPVLTEAVIPARYAD